VENEAGGHANRGRLLPPRVLLFGLLAMGALHFLLPAREVIGSPWNLLGAVPLVLGVALNLIADRALKEAHTTVRPFERTSALLTTGVFGLTRNPMYLGFALILLGLAVFLGSAAPFVVVLVISALLDILFIRHEERMLEETFGEEWRRYRSRVGRWL
jgi:protein-S-isoprenylcysteine O-methyltransferase Ste14